MAWILSTIVFGLFGFADAWRDDEGFDPQPLPSLVWCRGRPSPGPCRDAWRIARHGRRTLPKRLRMHKPQCSALRGDNGGPSPVPHAAIQHAS